MHRRDFVRSSVAAAALLGAAVASAMAADNYPTKPIRVIVPYPAGGVVDMQARAVTQAMEHMLKQPIVVEPRPGASGSIAAEAVANAPADGYTLLVSAPFLLTQPLLESNLRWSPSQFVPVGRFSQTPSYFVVSADSPASTVKEFVELARQAQPPLQYANPGNGTTQWMSTELFRVEAGIQLDPVMYKGAPPTVPDLVRGLTAMTVMPSSVAIPHIQSGKLRALANMAGNRSTQLPDVPTIAEAGYPGATVLSWYGFHVRAGTPEPIIRKLAAALAVAATSPEAAQRMATGGGEPAHLDTAEFKAFLTDDLQHWSKAVKTSAK